MLLDEIRFLHRRMVESLGEDSAIYDEIVSLSVSAAQKALLCFEA